MGTETLRRLTPRFRDGFKGPVFAVLKAENVRSFDAFARAGYQIAAERDWQRLTDGQHNLIVMSWGS